jgi:NAD(P)-dependent dehydrogenase (short-subunit alcohol dehydrogenase family)
VQRAVEDLRGKNINVRGVHTDVARRDSMRKAAVETISAFGKVHVVCNSANASPTNGLLGSLSEADWDRIIDINIHAVVHAAEVFVPLIESHGEGGHIVNVGSAGSFIVEPGGEADCGTHFAVAALSEGWSDQLGPRNIGASIVCPVVGIAPESLGRRVIDGIKNDELYIFTQSGEFREMAEGRFEPIREAFRKSQLSPTLRDLPSRILPFA